MEKSKSHEFNVNLDEVDFNNFILKEGQLPLFGTEAVQLSFLFGSEVEVDSEPEEEEQVLPEGEHRHFVYSWRWCGDKRFAKIGRTRNGLEGVKKRMVTTYHPTDDPVPLGVRKCADMEESHKTEQYILTGLGRTRRDREWVKINEAFNELLEKSFSAVRLKNHSLLLI
ncbi:MAG: GIY-YIG nuclease family protein [Candidatus Poribacteria bacterium]|nr:GIY-YIG nuclease family protein [Candidatus Poribacteria bacterium]